MPIISKFSNAWHTKGGEVIGVNMFLDHVRSGTYQDIVLPIRAISDKDKRGEAKKKAPLVTISGRFQERRESALIEHSGFIAIDIDDVNPEEIKKTLSHDPYVYAAFVSISGRGVCSIFRIDGRKHREAFAALSEYLYRKYGIVVDASGKDPSRARFVSFDPYLLHNEAAKKFEFKPTKETSKQIPEVPFVQNDFDHIISQICEQRLDLTGDYSTWLRIGFALSDKFGENGRSYFHQISQFHPSYNSHVCDKQYSSCLKAGGSGVTISTLYWYANQAGLTTVSERTQSIATAGYFAKKGSKSKESATTYLLESKRIPEEESRPIIDQIFQSKIVPLKETSLIDQLRQWLNQSFNLRRNEITRKIEIDGEEMDDIRFNDVYCQAKVIFDKVNAEILERLLYSNHTPSYNPFIEFFDSNAGQHPQGVINRFFDCVNTDTGVGKYEFFPDYLRHFGTKWLVGIIASIHGQHSPLMLVFSGRQGNGKTRFFRDLLPRELQPYFSESKMDNGKDDDILMCKKLIIFDDEMSGKSKKEEKRMKELLSRDAITVRLPYGRTSITLKRLAVFCGTTNEEEILHDPTGNRRIIPVNVLSIKYEEINAIDRTALFMEAYWLFKNGYDWQLSSHDIQMLNSATGKFEAHSVEYELLCRYYRVPQSREDFEVRTATDIATALERLTNNHRITRERVGRELRRIGFKVGTYRVGGTSFPKKAYEVIELHHNDGVLRAGAHL